MKKITFFYLVNLLFFACNKEEDISSKTGFAASGSALIVNEGAYGSNNGSITFIDGQDNITQNVFEAANAGNNLGDIVQSYTSDGAIGICVVNNSNKVVKVNAATFSQDKILSGAQIPYPRYAFVLGQKIYISTWDTDSCLKVVDRNSFTITHKIRTGKGAEKMMLNGGKLYVANSGGFGNDNTVSIVNTDSDTKIMDISVGDAPLDMVKDANGDIWVLCRGRFDYSNYPLYSRESPALLLKISGNSNNVIKELTLIPTGSLSDANQLEISPDGKVLYYLVDGHIFKKNTTDDTLPTTPFIADRYYYGLNVHPQSGEIWATTSTFAANGTAYRFRPSGSLVSSYGTGLGPSMVWFNP